MENNMSNIRRQVVENSEELQDFLRDLSNWEKDIKKKDQELRTSPSEPKKFPPIRKPIQKSNPKKPDSNKEPQMQNEGDKLRILDDLEVSSKDSDKPNDDHAPMEKSDQEKPAKKSKIESLQIEKSATKEVHSSSDDEDDDDEEEEEEELNEAHLKQKALFDKDRGNKFFSEGKYDDAIACYTSGIMADPTNAVLPANRAMALIKKGQLAAAEQDCTLSISVDHMYAKAFFRRGTCRLGLKKLVLARQDFLKVMELEPGNKFARIELDKLEEEFKKQDVPRLNPATNEQKHIETTARNAEIEAKKEGSTSENRIEPVTHTKGTVQTALKSRPEVVDSKKPKKTSALETESKQKRSSVFSNLPDQVKPVYKPAHLKLKGSLQKIPIEVRSSDEETEELVIPVSVERPKSLVLSTGGVPSSSSSLTPSTPASTPTVPTVLPTVPQTAFQFETDWRRLRHWPHLRTQYLKTIPPVTLQQLYNKSMETEIFVDIIHCLEEISSGDQETAFGFLKSLSKVGRFSTTVMFLSADETKIIKKILETASSSVSSEDVKTLTSLYGL